MLKGIPKNLEQNLLDEAFIKNAVKKAVKNGDFDSLRSDETTEIPSGVTIEDEILSVKVNLKNMKSIILEEVDSLKRNSNTKKNLQQATDFYKSNIHDIEKKVENIVQKEKLNKRISQFYNNDYDLKKTMLYYLKIFYFIMVSITIITIVYKKKHKEKKLYVFLFLLLIIPYFLINKIYRIVLNNLGHLKIDVLYVIFLIIISLISYGVFFVSKFVLKKKQGNLKDILIETADTLKSNSSIIT
tara:strand:- start:1774 stop:2502 length:729 start_codon:yes stop_codon:yes gene_type:complete